MVFADSSALAALIIPTDINHIKALRWIKENSGQEIITTDYIIDELYTLILARTKNKDWTINAISGFRESNWISSVIFITQTDFYQAEQIFLAYQDKGWSFTDCTCKIIMERLAITTVFTFDSHFNQFGTVTVVPI
ncbi:MAG: DNA-binding protein [Patescibacteria group bacterium]